jgi:integrase
MRPWDAAQLAAFLGWSAGHSQHHAAWTLLAMTGMRRGEALALRWRDVDLDAGTVSVRRDLMCPRGESPLTYMPVITGELVLEGSE